MYHSISKDKENGIHPYYKVNTSPVIFAEHMNYLYENNYAIISLAEAVKIMNSYRQPKQSVKQLTNKLRNYAVITFDDGFRDFYTQAFPILQEHVFTATVFLPTEFIDNTGLKLTGKAHLSWNEVRELKSYGINFGSHTVTHPQLKLLKREDVEHEIRYSKETIEDKLGESIDSFSYPFAFPEEDKESTRYLKDILIKCGYKCGVSTRIGTTSIKDYIFFMKRLPVNSCDDPKLFKAKLEGGYDWLYFVQYSKKRLRSH